jgi:3D (Asp-Asp-Asp) domain-containing protein
VADGSHRVLPLSHAWARRSQRQPQLRPGIELEATAYSQGSVTASGVAPYVGDVASNLYPLGTHIMVSPAVWGRTRFVVLDRVGCCTDVDFYTPSTPQAIDFGRRVERVQVVR